MSTQDIEALKKALVDAGVEIYRVEPGVLHIAERIRLHLMDAGVRVRLEGGAPVVSFTVRSQRSDFPHASPESLFDRVREAVGTEAGPRGYVEVRHHTVEVKDPVDDTRVLDVWYEVDLEKRASSVEDAVAEIRWALGVEKYVSR